MCPHTGVLEEKQTAFDSLQTRLSTSEDALAVLSESSKLAKGENNRLKDELDAIRQRDTQVLSLLALLVQSANTDAAKRRAGCLPPKGHAVFTTLVYLPCWYKSTNADAAKGHAARTG